jgi:hypothetical protein
MAKSQAHAAHGMKMPVGWNQVTLPAADFIDRDFLGTWHNEIVVKTSRNVRKAYIGPDIVEGVRRTKSQGGPDLILFSTYKVAGPLKTG